MPPFICTIISAHFKDYLLNCGFKISSIIFIIENLKNERIDFTRINEIVRHSCEC